jgi:murein L,D-transpeptidase YcbB/YkuD
VETISNPAVVSRTVRLQRPVPVIFVYMTAVAMPDGSVRFARDVYGQDAALDRALRQQQ